MSPELALPRMPAVVPTEQPHRAAAGVILRTCEPESGRRESLSTDVGGPNKLQCQTKFCCTDTEIFAKERNEEIVRQIACLGRAE